MRTPWDTMHGSIMWLHAYKITTKMRWYASAVKILSELVHCLHSICVHNVHVHVPTYNASHYVIHHNGLHHHYYRFVRVPLIKAYHYAQHTYLYVHVQRTSFIQEKINGKVVVFYLKKPAYEAIASSATEPQAWRHTTILLQMDALHLE